MKGKLIAYAFWTVSTILFVALMGYVLFLENFDLFDTSEKKVIGYKCDYEGLRQAEIYRQDGNAVTRPSIHVSVQLDCDNYERKDEKLVFTVDDSSLADNDVNIKWITFDTLQIEYRRGLRIFTQLDKVEYPDSTLNVVVAYYELE